MADIYCGNNALHPDLVNGIKVMGSRYQCLRKGIGTGFNLPIDPDYGLPYEPIDNRKIYCGNQNILPDGYDSLGNAPQCLQKGIGIGKLQKAQEDLDAPELDNGLKRNKNVNKKFILLFSIYIIVFILLYILKPKIVCKKTLIYTKEIDWKNFILFYFFTCITIFIFYILINK
jgi:hypothetical protein